MKVCFVTGRMDAGGVPVLLSELVQCSDGEVSYCLAAPLGDRPYGATALRVLGPDKCLNIAHRAFRFQDVVRLFRFIGRENIDLVSCEGKSGGIVGRIAAALARRPSVYVYHGVHYMDYDQLKRNVYFRVERALSIASAAVVAVSSEERCLITRLRLCDGDKLRLCENGVAGAQKPVSMPWPSNPLQFVHITRFNRQKNSELLLDICESLRAIRRLDRFRFLVIGDGEPGARDEFEKKIADKKLGEAVACHGHVSNIQSFLAPSHGLLSTSRWEGQPLGVLECMAASRCVVATDVVGHQSIIRHGRNGLLFKEGDARGGARQLAQLLEMPRLLNSLADAGRQLWEAKYSLAQCARRRADLYRSVLAAAN